MSTYDFIVVGARAAGSSLATLLARSGAKVGVIDRDRFPRDTLSTHTVFPNGVARLDQLGVLDRLLERHELAFMEHRSWVLGRQVAGRYPAVNGHDGAIAPRRVVLDAALVDAAREAGAELRLGNAVAKLIGTGTEDDPVSGVVLENGERVYARRVLGADGRASTVARLLGLKKEREMSGECSLSFAYWRGLRSDWYVTLGATEDAMFTRVECEDGIHMILAGGDSEHTHGSRLERERKYFDVLSRFPDLLDMVELERATLVSELRYAPESLMRGYFRRPSGPGWALLGDAAHFKHPASAQGIADALAHAFHLAGALTRSDPELRRYRLWLDDRAAGHYEWSFKLGSFPREETAGPVFDRLERDPAAARDYLGTFTRHVNPGELSARRTQLAA
ncbi:MAG TPA: NAD(P)/FAD-dependent oxidoreductase [Thermoleophilaceae bacterium]